MTTDQKDTALNLLRVAAKNGSWVCLKNLQLVIDWLPTLARELRQLKQTKVHMNFQLWLTAEHHVGFSEELLEHCEKIAFEPPQGLQQNMLRTYSTWEKNLVWNDKATQEINSPGLYFAVAWIHSLLQERNWYDQQVRGETINFGRGELKAAELMVKAGTSSLDALHSLMKEYVYGGKLDDAFDVQIVGAYVRMYLSDKSIGGNPNSSEFSSHYHAISKIPLEPNMCLLGLPNNSNRSLQQALCVNVTHNLKRIELGRLRQEKNKDEKILTVALSPIADLWNELINEYRQLSSKKVLGDKENKSSHADGSSPLQIFLNNEERFGQHVFTTINKWFEELNKIISTDDPIICQQQQSYCDALLRGEVPEQWRKLWEGPKEATQWLNAMCARLSASLDRGVR